MAEDEYEALPSSKMTTHMLAGAAAGVMEHTIMYPVDCVKTRMQCLNPNPKANYRNVADALYRIIRYEGLANSMRGINAVVSGAGPAHALYFACYEKMKRVLSSSPQGTHLSRGLAGVFATLLHDAVMNPAEVVKQRMQVYDSPYKTCTECLQDILRREGMVAFYRSYTTQLSMNIPFQSIHFMVYEFFQDMLNMERQYKPSTHVISGAMAGAVAAAATTPLDVCKTLLNTQERCAVTKSGSTITGLTQAFRTVYQFQGFKGYFRGVSARVIHQMPGTAISWSVYEFFKFFITKRQQASCDGFVSPASVAAVQLHSVSSEDDITP